LKTVGLPQSFLGLLNVPVRVPLPVPDQRNKSA
jgi:hypothetical protein